MPVYRYRYRKFRCRYDNDYPGGCESPPIRPFLKGFFDPPAHVDTVGGQLRQLT